MTNPRWIKPFALGAALAGGLLWAQAPTAQSGGHGTALAVDHAGHVWQATGGAVRRCHFSEPGFRPVCSPWQ